MTKTKQAEGAYTELCFTDEEFRDRMRRDAQARGLMPLFEQSDKKPRALRRQGLPSQHLSDLRRDISMLDPQDAVRAAIQLSA